MHKTKHILIINPFGIGDVLFSTPLIKNLRFYYPDAFIAVAVQKKIVPVLENNPHINKIIPFSRGDFKDLSRQSRLKAIGLLLKTIGEILHYKFDLCIDLSLEHRYSLALKFLVLNRRLGFNFRNRGRFLTQRINLDGYEEKHVVEYHLEILKFLGLKQKPCNLELYLKQKEHDWAEVLLSKFGVLQEDLVIGIIPGGGASWGNKNYLKHWPSDRFVQVADGLIDRFNAKIIFFADTTEREVAGGVIQHMRHPAIDMIGKTTLRQLMALINRCRLVIANDGGVLHLAVGLGVKTVSMFGPVDERVYGPYPNSCKHVVMSKDVSCRPCYRKFRVPECNYQLRCLTAITVHEVLYEAERLLKNVWTISGKS